MYDKKIHIAPCGIVCNLCLGFQREKNKCVGCTVLGSKPPRCEMCGFKQCMEKKGNNIAYCDQCPKFPCRRMKNLEKRYSLNYGESPIENLKSMRKSGVETFSTLMIQNWKCPQCGALLCVHRRNCLHCGAKNDHFLKRKHTS